MNFSEISFSRPCQVQPSNSELDLYRHNLTLNQDHNLAITSYEYMDSNQLTDR